MNQGKFEHVASVVTAVAASTTDSFVVSHSIMITLIVALSVLVAVFSLGQPTGPKDLE